MIINEKKYYKIKTLLKEECFRGERGSGSLRIVDLIAINPTVWKTRGQGTRTGIWKEGGTDVAEKHRNLLF
jgi:hypothetical protein